MSLYGLCFLFFIDGCIIALLIVTISGARDALLARGFHELLLKKE